MKEETFYVKKMKSNDESFISFRLKKSHSSLFIYIYKRFVQPSNMNVWHHHKASTESKAENALDSLMLNVFPVYEARGQEFG